MKKLIAFYFLILSTNLVDAQNPSFMWANSIIKVAPSKLAIYWVTADTIGNAYAVGMMGDTTDFNPSGGGYLLSNLSPLTSSGFIVKYDVAGNFVWAKQLVGVGSSASANFIKLDKAGNIYVTGAFSGTIDFDPGVGIFNLSSTLPLALDLFILKLDPNGNFLWVKGVNGNNENHSSSLALDQLGNIYISGNFVGTTDFDPGPGSAITSTSNLSYFDLFILKLDSAGNYLWAKTIGGGLDEFCYSINVDAAGNVFATGSFHDTVDFDPGVGIFNLTSNSFFYSDSYILKLNSSGNLIWAKNVGGTYHDYGMGLVLDSISNVYTIGTYWGTADFDPDSASVFNLSGGTGYVLKLDASGNFIWAKGMDAGIQPTAIAIDNAANIYATGVFNGTIDFDPGIGIANLTSLTLQDMFISKLDATGNFQSAVGIGGTSLLSSASIATDVLNNIYTAGKYDGTIDFNPGLGIYNLSGSFDLFVLKLSQGDPVSSINETNGDNDISVFPNPSTNKVVIQSKNGINEITLTNILGEKIYQTTEMGEKIHSVDFTNYDSGMYFLSIMFDNKIVTKKIVKQ